jgi:single-strand DNA-binding protein
MKEGILFDTNLVIVGNVLTAPEWRRIQSSGSLVANFRVASTARRFDREHNRWVDGNNMRVRVVAWRRLAEGVASSITVGDPVIIYGRVYTRDWKDENGNGRTSYEMEAFSIGHDLARGRGRFFRTRAGQGTSTVEDAEAEAVLGGELTVPVGPEETPVGFGDGMPARLPGEDEPTFLDVVAGEPATEVTAVAETPAQEEAAETPAQEEAAETPAQEEQEKDEDGSAEEEVPAEDELTLEVERLVAAQPATARRTRRTKREPVAA